MPFSSNRHLQRTFFYSLLWGLAAHGLALTNVFAIHDNVHYFFSVGATYSSGRWFLGVLDELVIGLTGRHCASPLWNGLLCLIFSGLSAWVLAEILCLQKQGSLILLSGLLVVSPALAGLLGYTFTAPYYLFAQLLCLCGAAAVVRLPGIRGVLLGGIGIACAMGIYQSYLPMALCSLLLAFCGELRTHPDQAFKDVLRRIFRYGLVCILALAIYFGLEQLFLTLKDETLTDYMGISEVGSSGIRAYLSRIPTVYRLFLRPDQGTPNANLFPGRILTLYYICMALAALLAETVFIRLLRQNIAKGICFLLAALSYPLAANLIYVMCPNLWDTHILMLCSLIMIFVPLLSLSESIEKVSASGSTMRKLCVLALAILCLGYARFDNYSHTRLSVYQTRSVNFFNRMVSRIESTPGYVDTMPVAYVGSRPHAASFTGLEGFDADPLPPILNSESYFYSYSWQEEIAFWCGFSPESADPSSFQNLPEVRAMPCYPDDGSIRILDGTVVIKLAEE